MRNHCKTFISLILRTSWFLLRIGKIYINIGVNCEVFQIGGINLLLLVKIGKTSLDVFSTSLVHMLIKFINYPCSNS